MKPSEHKVFEYVEKHMSDGPFRDDMLSLRAEIARLEEELKEERYAIEQYRRANEGLAVSKDKLESDLAEAEYQSVICPECGSCGEVGCCGIRCLYVEMQQGDYDDLLKENNALSALLSPLVDIELERDTLKSALDVAMSENQRLTKYVEDYKEENAELKRENDSLKLTLETTNALMSDVY